MKTFFTQKEATGGYVALMATIIIAAILLVMSVEGSLAGWHARFNILGTEAKEQATSLAQGCADQALSAIMTDPSYTGDATTTSSVGTCYVFPIAFNAPIAGVVTIRAQANVRGSFANLEMQINMSEIHIDSVPEAPTKGTLVVITNVVNDGSGNNDASDFDMHVSGGNPSDSSFNGNESGVVVTVDPGSYSVTQDTEGGYKTSVSTNCSGNIVSGAIKFCTVTNDDITTTLTILVNVVNNNGGNLQYTDFPVMIDGALVTVGVAKNVSVGAHTASFTPVAKYAASSWGFQCSSGGGVVVNEGDNKTCIINFDDALPPAPSCADTVMVLDRTGSMSSGDRANEATAANSLTDLYASVAPPATPPHLSVGSIGGTDGTAASIPLLGQLSTIYANIKSAIASITGGTSSVGSDLSAGINAAIAELNGTRHVAGNEKVLVLVSDGDPNKPTGSVSTDTGFRFATSSSQESGTSLWGTPAGAYADGGVDASALVTNSTNRERYYDFNFGNGIGLPAGATVNGIQAQVDAWATAGQTSIPASSVKSPSAAATPNQWVNPTGVSSSNNVYAVSSTNGQQQSFAGFGFNIPSNATVTGVQVVSEAKITGAPITTALLPTGNQGNYTSWTNGAATIDDAGTPDCSSADSIIENNPNRRESAAVSLSSIPNGSVITAVTVTAYDRGDTVAGGTYRTFARLNGADTDAAGGALAATGGGAGSSCTANQQLIDVADTVKSAGTSLEIGVVKVPGSNSSVRVGALRATVTYATPTTGSYTVQLSSDNGGAWTASKSIALSSTESVSSPSGNTATDLWNRQWSASDFSDGSFLLKVQNTSASGATLYVDQLSVTVNYTVPGSSGTSCQLGVDLSWNGGTTWSTEKTQAVTNVETSYIVPAVSNDDWSSLHTWSASEFSNANFRARVRAIDTGSSCDDAALVHLDSLQMKVFYTQNTDPVQSALTAADNAKLSDISLFTIHFGTDVSGYNGKELLANLANGSTAVSGHENGSVSDANSIVSGDTNFLAPQAAVTPNQWTNPNSALLSDDTYATDAVSGHLQGFSGFGFTIPPGAIVSGIAIEVEAKSADQSGCQVGAEVSADNGTTFSNTGSVSTIAGTDAVYTQGGSTSMWGRSSWSASDLSDAKFIVRLRNTDPGNACTNNSTLSVDRVRTRVYYSVNQENGDGDNFFVAPTSADMKGIFDYIAGQVCPALGFAGAAQAPTTGQVTVITQVINNNGGSVAASSIPTKVTGTNPSPSTFNGSSGGTPVTLDPGSYSISGTTPSGYVEVQGAGCSSADAGNITAGEFRVCVLTYDDVPPPPPPPDLTIHLGSWKELPVAN